MSIESSLSPHSDLSLFGDDRSSSADASPTPLSSIAEKVPCQICRLQDAAVTYFNTLVCSGCRAFFRRSVKKHKTYQCLNSRLCGKNSLVPNRRVCKYCRFQRCVDAGMLDAKVRMQNRVNDISRSSAPTQIVQMLLSSAASTSDSPSTSSSAAPSPLADDILSQYSLFRHRVLLERYKLYGSCMETRVAESGIHDLETQLNEHTLFNRVARQTDNLFSAIDDDDWHTLSIFEYSMWWSVVEQVGFTVRNYGHDLNRVYNMDCTYNPLNAAHCRQHWQYLRPLIAETAALTGGIDPDAAFDLITEYMLGVQVTMSKTVGLAMARAQLDEQELAALVLLLMTRPACLELVSARSRQHLAAIRDQCLAQLAAHIRQSGRNVDERMGQIIFLTTDFQNLGRLVKHSNRLLMSATNYRAAPREFAQHFQEMLSFHSQIAVF